MFVGMCVHVHKNCEQRPDVQAATGIFSFGLDRGRNCLADKTRVYRICLLLMIEVLYVRHLSPQSSPKQENACSCLNA